MIELTRSLNLRERTLIALLNSEVKCVALMELDRNRGKGRQKLRTDFVELVDGIWRPGTRTIFATCEDSLIPNGMAAKFDQNKVILTQEGEEYGQPIAAHLLYQSVNLKHPLKQIFGRTMDRGRSQGAVTRADLLEYLSILGQGNRCRIVDIEIFPHLRQHVVSKSAQHLASLGYLLFFPGENHQTRRISEVRLNPNFSGNIEPVDSYPRLTSRVHDFIGAGFTNSPSIAEKIRPEYPNYKVAVLGQDSLVSDIDCIIRGLLEKGVLQPSGIVRETETSVEITPQGEELVKKLLKPIDEVCNGDMESAERLQKYSWKEVAPRAVERYAKFSNYIGRKNN